MTMQKIESGFKRGFERLGLITPSMLAPKVLKVLKSYQNEGFGTVTTPQIKERLEELYPTKGWLPIATGNVAGAISLLEKKGEIDIKVVTHQDEAGVHDMLTYSIVEKPQKPQTTSL